MLFLQLIIKTGIISKHIRCHLLSSLLVQPLHPEFPTSTLGSQLLCSLRWAFRYQESSALFDAWTDVLKPLTHMAKYSAGFDHRLYKLPPTNEKNCHLNYWWWLSYLNIVFPISFITFCFRMAGRRKRRTSQMAWHITEFHGVAFLQVLLSKSNLFGITETKYALLTDFLHFTAHEDDWTSL